MPTGYQIFKSEISPTIKKTYFTDYTLKENERMITLVTSKCKEEWEHLSVIQKQLYERKADVASKAYVANKAESKAKKVQVVESEPVLESESDDEMEVEQINIYGKDYFMNEKTGDIYHPKTQEIVGKSKKGKHTIWHELKKTKTKSIVKEEFPPPYIDPVKNNKKSSNPSKRKNIPKAVKQCVWKKYISDTCLKGKCFVGCGTSIQIHNFEVGHVIAFANGGEDIIDNLRPICYLCNRSMGTTNLNEFIEKFGFKDNNYDVEINSNLDTISSAVSDGLVLVVSTTLTLFVIDAFYKLRKTFN
jgi:hypothetical protein